MSTRMCASPGCSNSLAPDAHHFQRYCDSCREARAGRGRKPQHSLAAIPAPPGEPSAPPTPSVPQPTATEAYPAVAPARFSIARTAALAMFALLCALLLVATRRTDHDAPAPAPSAAALEPTSSPRSPARMCGALPDEPLSPTPSWTRFAENDFGCGGELKDGRPNAAGLANKVQFEASSRTSERVEAFSVGAVVNNPRERASTLKRLYEVTSKLFGNIGLTAPQSVLDSIPHAEPKRASMDYGTVSLSRAKANIEIWELRVEFSGTWSLEASAVASTPDRVPVTAPTSELTANELATADYRGLAEDACSRGWSAIARAGGSGEFDKKSFDENCVRRLTQVGKDCAQVRHTAATVAECVREAAPDVALRVLAESL